MKKWFGILSVFTGFFVVAQSVPYPDIGGAKLRDAAAGTVDLAICAPEPGQAASLRKMDNVEFIIYSRPATRSSGLLPGNHRNDQGWNALAIGERDGISVGQVTENYLPLLCVPATGAISLSVTVPRGAYLAFQIYGAMTFTLHTNDGNSIPFPAGEKGIWTADARPLPVARLIADRNAMWSGFKPQTWHHANTLIQSYGAGEIAYLAVLPATLIRLPENTAIMEFTMIGRDNRQVTFANPVPPGATEVAIVHIAPYASQLVWKLPAGWTGGRNIRHSIKENSLTILENSLKLKERSHP